LYRDIEPPYVMTQTAEKTGTATQVGPLDVGLAVDVDVATGCPLSDTDVDEVRQSVTRSDLGDRETCQVAVDGTESRGYERTPVEDACPCSVFDEHDCISRLDSIRDGRLLFSLVVPDREVLRSVIGDLRAGGATVSLERIHTETEGDEMRTDGVSLTPKQREVLVLAVESGYYDRPREATLDDLADEIGVTPSAVSQRLNAVERKLVCERAGKFDVR